ncbi:MAG TPA: tetratricopeptide repeat protein [Steroidobacteraceae bacterium]|nr:tetratricopeptide repeat protein [Steroidobacteraceae bacterium]
MSAGEPLARAAALLRRGATEDARAALAAIVAKHPTDAEALHLLGLAHKQAGDLVGALEWMRRSLDCDPRRTDYLGNLGNVLVGLHRPGDAEAAYRAALARDAHFRPACLGLARVLTQTGRAAEAIEQAGALLVRDDRDAEAWACMGAAHAQAGTTADATRAFERALALRPGYGFARYGLATILLRLHRTEAALEHFERAARDGLDTPALARSRAEALFDLGRFDEAERTLDAGVARWPTDLEAHRLLAQLRFTRGDPAFARSLEQAVSNFPTLPALAAALADVLRRAGDPTRSEAVARSAIARLGTTAGLLAALTLALQDQGRYDEALLCATEAHTSAPLDAGLAENVVVLLLALGRAADAWPIIETQRARRPRDQRWLAHLATAARLRGMPEYDALYDYARFVRAFELGVPEGWPSLEAFHAELLPALEARHLLQAAPLDQSLRFGTQTARSLLAETHPAIRALLDALLACVEQYRAGLGHDDTHPYLRRNTGPVHMTGCWSVRLRRGGHHVNHVHPEGWISSAYYVQVPAEVADDGLRSGWIKFGEPNVPTPGAPPAHHVQPRAGRLVLFPSYMWHGTLPIHGDEPRVTVAFDAVPD